MKLNKWLILKIVLILIGVCLAIYKGALTSYSNPPSTVNSIFELVFMEIIGFQFLIGMQAFNKKSDELWFKPSWLCNPFNASQPLCFFHFGGWFILLSTFPTVLFTYFQSPIYIYDALTPFLLGIGILPSVKVSEFLFRFKFKNV